jgi:hypothetical protein
MPSLLPVFTPLASAFAWDGRRADPLPDLGAGSAVDPGLARELASGKPEVPKSESESE